MLKKRLIGLVTVKDGWAVQSVGYKRYFPLGKVECLVENLDRWGADEIVVQVIDRSKNNSGPDIILLDRLAHLGLETPLIYGGGIRSVQDAVSIIQTGADRVIVDALLHQDLTAVHGISDRLGAQAVVAALPLSSNNGTIEWLDYMQATSTVLPADLLSFLNSGVVSEALIIDWKHEGHKNSFDADLVSDFPIQIPKILFGGINDQKQMEKLLGIESVTAIAVGNCLNYREHAIQKFKEALSTMPIRLPVYESSFIN